MAAVIRCAAVAIGIERISLPDKGARIHDEGKHGSGEEKDGFFHKVVVSPPDMRAAGDGGILHMICHW